MINKKPFITNKKVKEIIKGFDSNVKVISIKKLSHGINNAMYRIILSNNKDIILRICNDQTWWQIIKEYFIYELINKKTDILTPVFIYHVFSKKRIPNNYAIYESIKGKNLSEFNKIRNWEELTKNLAKNLAKIHNIHFVGCGHICKNFDNGKIWTDNKTWLNFFSEVFNYFLEELKETPFKEYYEDIKNYYKENKLKINIKFKPSLIHTDYAPENILINKNEQITGIIDFESNFSGHSEYDLSWSLMKLFEKNPGDNIKDYAKYQKVFLEEYNKNFPIKKNFEERKKIYDLCHLMRIARWNYPKVIINMNKKQKQVFYKKIANKIEVIIKNKN